MGKFKDCKYGALALSISVAELLILCIGLATIYIAGRWGQAPQWVRGFYEIVSAAAPVGLILGVIGIIRDSRRLYAVLGLISGLAVCGIYGVLMAA
jgi:hypothetical protein